MKIITENTNFVLITYDLPSPDSWNSYYRIICDLSKNEIIENKMATLITDGLIPMELFTVEADVPEERNITNIRVDVETKQKGRKKTTNKRTTRTNRLKTLIEYLNNDQKLQWYDFVEQIFNYPEIFTIYVDKNHVTEENDIYSILGEFKLALRNRTPNKKANLTKVKKLEWEFSYKTIFDDDLIPNRKYNPQIENGKSKEFIPIDRSFKSARISATSKINEYYVSVSKSVFMVNPESTFAPNVRIFDDEGNKIFYYDENRPKVNYTFQYDNSAETVWDRNKYIPVGLEEGNEWRDPRLGDTIEEILIAEVMPMYAITRNFMQGNNESFRARFRSHSRMFLGSFNDWVLAFPNKPSSSTASVTYMKNINKKFEDKEKKKPRFQALSEDISNVINDIKNNKYNIIESRGMLGRIYQNRLNEYKRLIFQYPKAQNLNNETMTEFVSELNKNEKMKERIREESSSTSDRFLVTEKILRRYLKKGGWIYTIPNELIIDDELITELKEQENIKKTRKKIEAELKEIFDEL